MGPLSSYHFPYDYPAPATYNGSLVVDRDACFDTCRFASDGVCDDGRPGAEYNDCPYGTDCSDCKFVMPPAPGETEVGSGDDGWLRRRSLGIREALARDSGLLSHSEVVLCAMGVGPRRYSDPLVNEAGHFLSKVAPPIISLSNDA